MVATAIKLPVDDGAQPEFCSRGLELLNIFCLKNVLIKLATEQTADAAQACYIRVSGDHSAAGGHGNLEVSEAPRFLIVVLMPFRSNFAHF